MHLATSALGNALSNGPPALHYPVTPCHYGNQQATYGMMAGDLVMVMVVVTTMMGMMIMMMM